MQQLVRQQPLWHFKLDPMDVEDQHLDPLLQLQQLYKHQPSILFKLGVFGSCEEFFRWLTQVTAKSIGLGVFP